MNSIQNMDRDNGMVNNEQQGAKCAHMENEDENTKRNYGHSEETQSNKFNL